MVPSMTSAAGGLIQFEASEINEAGHFNYEEPKTRSVLDDTQGDALTVVDFAFDSRVTKRQRGSSNSCLRSYDR